MVDSFLNVNMQKIDVIDGFALDTILMESEMRKHTGIDILSSDFKNVDEKLLRNYVAFFEEDDGDRIKALTEKYPNINGPNSILLKSEKELSTHLSNIYQISFFHYVLAKKHNLRGSFPELCCKRSSKNVMLSLFDKGYPGVSFASADGMDHNYNIIPFVIENENVKGSIVLDATYDQFPFGKNMRNAVSIRIGSDWEYKSPDGKSMYPGFVCAIDNIKKTYGRDISGAHNARDFFALAFSNQIRIEGK